MIVVSAKWQLWHRIFGYGLGLTPVRLSRKMAVTTHAEVINVLEQFVGANSERVAHPNPRESIYSLCCTGIALFDSRLSRLLAIWTIYLFRSFAKAIQRRYMSWRSKNPLPRFGNEARSSPSSRFAWEKVVEDTLQLVVDVAGV